MLSPRGESRSESGCWHAISRHKTSRPVTDQGGTAGDAAKSKTWNPAQWFFKSFGGLWFQSSAEKNPIVRELFAIDVRASGNEKRPGLPGRSSILEAVKSL
jgi:hypothetical protein